MADLSDLGVGKCPPQARVFGPADQEVTSSDDCDDDERKEPNREEQTHDYDACTTRVSRAG